MTLAAKIQMCLMLWMPPEGLHHESGDLLSYWYNQKMEIVEQAILGRKPPWTVNGPVLTWEAFVYGFSLPNSDYLPIPDCIWAESLES